MSKTTDRWSVSPHCINCMASRSLAPQLMAEKDGRSVFEQQPETEEEARAAWRAAQVCPVDAVIAPSKLRPPGALFPQDLGGGIHRLGHNTRQSYGAHSYFVRTHSARAMVDGPRWSSELAQWMEAQGGLDHILLTHRDDVGDAERYANHFGAEVWIHEADADSAPFATTIIGAETTRTPLSEITILPLPGHTRGSVGYLLAGHTLFTGDTLAWDARERMLRGYRRYCWFDWDTQVASIAGLAGIGFSQILAGHGGSVSLAPEEMDLEIRRFVARERG